MEAVLDTVELPQAEAAAEAAEQEVLVATVRERLTVVLEATQPFKAPQWATLLQAVAHREETQAQPLKMASALNMVVAEAVVKAPVETHMGKVAVRFMGQAEERLVATTAAELLAQVVLGVRILQAAEGRLVQGELVQAQAALVIHRSLGVVMAVAAEAIRQVQVVALEQLAVLAEPLAVGVEAAVAQETGRVLVE